MESFRISLPCGGETTDHDIESIIIGLRNSGEEKGSVWKVFEINDFGEKEVWFLDGVYEQLGVDLLY